ncbi:transglutaminase TgpA family protein [Virgibacillus sp. MG-45]|uniref:transglutaminase TgpA family protein n=1 Tax=Virgibacillus sp. MG-45 TaxID=3102791 RepID=UPI002EDAC78A
MVKQDQNEIPFLYAFIMYVLGLLLFLEWLYPIGQITDTSNMNLFLVYALFCFVISLLQTRWWLSFLLKGFGMLFIIQALFFESSFFSMDWMLYMVDDFQWNVEALFSQRWYELTPLFRSTLFLVLIWLMSYLIHYWFVVVKRILLFVILTFIYLAVLDTFTAYKVGLSIIRPFVLAFIALGLSNFFRVLYDEGIRYAWARKNPRWIIPIIVTVLAASIIGVSAPKFGPQWSDPVPYIQAVTGYGNGSGGTVQKVGYGEDDSRLGGSFVQDDTVVFQAKVNEKHYWRIESKDIYTGKGWERSEELAYMEQTNSLSYNSFSQQVETEALEGEVEFAEPLKIKKLLYPYGTEKVEVDTNVRLLVDEELGEARTQINGKDISLKGYKLQYNHPSFPIELMKESFPNDSGDAEMRKRYLQLPETLPDRVYELAADITSDDYNRYDKVRSVEKYFSRNGFVYQISDVPVPSKDQDYVDQFLFDSQLGYCDNYSTSMVVMLRTLGIPARWVKGFTSGERIERGASTGKEFDVYEVTNKNAHSWVEVYFPKVGWVPFEPTQGFSNLAEFDVSTGTSSTDDTLDAPETETNPQEQQENIKKKEEETAVEASSSATKEKNPFSMNLFVYAGIVMLLGVTFMLYCRRFQLQTAFIERKLMQNPDAQTYQEAYHHLLKLLKRNGIPRDSDQTLREYAKRIDIRYDTDSMGQLTNVYERMLYNNEKNKSTTEITQLWKNLIKRIMG